MLVPFFDTFDFDVSVNDPTTPWADLKQKQIGVIGAYFDVLEQLAKLSKSQQAPQSPQAPTALHPDAVARVLARFRPPEGHANRVIRSVAAYSPELGRLAAANARRRTWTLVTRKDLAAASAAGSIGDHCATTRHVLDLMDRHVEEPRTRYGDAVDRAKLLVVHAALLTHLHARRVAPSQSRQILCMDVDADADVDHAGAADEYGSHEGFEAVVEVRRLVREAACRLEVADRQDAEIAWFLGKVPETMS